MKVFFDTSVLVTALVEALPNHGAAFELLVDKRKGRMAVTSTHALAECYATLTALPLPRRIQPMEARQMIEEGLERKLEALTLGKKHYGLALERVARLGLSSGAIYDALHMVSAEESSCARIYTFNLGHFVRFAPSRVDVMKP